LGWWDGPSRVAADCAALLADEVTDDGCEAFRLLQERQVSARLEAGQASVSLQDAAALIRLAREIERDDAVAAAAG